MIQVGFYHTNTLAATIKNINQEQITLRDSEITAFL